MEVIVYKMRQTWRANETKGGGTCELTDTNADKHLRKSSLENFLI